MTQICSVSVGSWKFLSEVTGFTFGCFVCTSCDRLISPPACGECVSSCLCRELSYQSIKRSTHRRLWSEIQLFLWIQSLLCLTMPRRSFVACSPVTPKHAATQYFSPWSPFCHLPLLPCRIIDKYVQSIEAEDSLSRISECTSRSGELSGPLPPQNPWLPAMTWCITAHIKIIWPFLGQQFKWKHIQFSLYQLHILATLYGTLF